MIDISKLDKIEVLMALYNNAKAQGMGFLQFINEPMERKTAMRLLEENSYFDYVQGRVMKVDLSQNEFDPRLYDRDNGEGAALQAIQSII